MFWYALLASCIPAASLFGLSSAADVVHGVNLGGWLQLEPWLTPSIFNTTGTPAVDEWHLCAALGKERCRKTLEAHWSNYYSRDDFLQMKAAGLNSVRIPVPYFAVDVLDFEPYVTGQFTYLVRAIQWAKEVGFTVLVDLHSVPGSQNGWEQTGLEGPIAFTNNQSNSDRALNVLRNFTTEFTKPEYSGVVTGIELMNEPIFDADLLRKFYTLGSNVVGAANSSGINITIHDAFFNPPQWKNYDPWNPSATTPAKHVTVDTHQFWGFPPQDALTQPEILDAVCAFGKTLRVPKSGIPPTIVGEWSLNTGVTGNSTTDSAQDVEKRTWFRTLFEAQNAAYAPNGPDEPSIGWYFWAWKTEYDIDAWSYRKGLAQGYIPSNISDPSKLVFPILNTGCIDRTFKYTASASVSTSLPTPTSGASSGTGGGSSSPTPTGAAVSLSASSTLLVLSCGFLLILLS